MNGHLANYLGQEKANEAFEKHWSTWFTQTDVDGIVAASLNTVRIPMGFWIIDDLVDRPAEGLRSGWARPACTSRFTSLHQSKTFNNDPSFLKIRGLTMLKAAGLHVLLDQHAMPGVSARTFSRLVHSK